MIKVTTLYDKDTLKGFKIIGHADYGEHGKDIVCAAVSMLAYTTVNSLDSYNYEVDFSDDEEIMELLVKNPSHDSEVILNIVRQRGTKIHPGNNVKKGGDDTLYAKCEGIVKFERKGRDRKQVSVYPKQDIA